MKYLTEAQKRRAAQNRANAAKATRAYFTKQPRDVDWDQAIARARDILDHYHPPRKNKEPVTR